VKICPRCSELFADDARFCPHDGHGLEKNTDRFLGRTIAARYHLIKRLGSGGMSIVYLARHQLISRMSALKILRPELSLIAEHRERFLREARAVNRINHPNIVEITDVGESDGVAYLVMEYVEGESLLVHIQRGRLPWERAAKIGMQVAGALARAHEMGIIHRDLKPENILLVPHPDGSEGVKLTDFGIAKVTGEASLTWSEQLFGTPGYIAPEYVGGIGVDGRSDIYSLAVVVYEMVTGVLPFEGRGQSELLLKPLTTAPIPPSQRVADLPPDFEALLLRCLAREPKDRPHDAFAMQDAFADVLRRFDPSGGRRASVAPQRASSLPPGEPQPHGREPIETIVDRSSLAARETANVGKFVTREMNNRWQTALADLEANIAKARRMGGAHAIAAARAAELAMVASEMLPRLDRAAKIVSDLQAKVDRLEATGREFRANLGHALDVLAHDRSREHAHLDALRARRQALERALAAGIPSAPPDLLVTAPLGKPLSTDPRVWEVEALSAEEKRAAAVVADLGFQIEALQKQLEAKNEEHERELVQATGQLEGSLSALRRLTGEIVRSIDDGVDILHSAS
jgi:serine/threonine-protein kinase